MVHGQRSVSDYSWLPADARFNEKIAPFRPIAHDFCTLNVSNAGHLCGDMLHQAIRRQDLRADPAHRFQGALIFAQF
jgi:hypothetical protein